MVDIYCTGGSFFGIDVEFKDFKQAICDSGPDDFIEFCFQDGTRGAIRKNSINGFCESD